MSCRCRCIPVVTSEVIDGDNLVLVCDSTPILSNTKKFCFRICPDIVSVVNEPYPVVMNMTANGTTVQVQLWDNAGNQVYSNTLYRGVIYSGKMGTVNTNHVVIYNTPCCRS